MSDMIIQVDRLNELAKLHLQMAQEYDMKKFWELAKRFDDIVALNKLEDALNKENQNA